MFLFIFDSFIHFVFIDRIIIYHFQHSHKSHSITTIQDTLNTAFIHSNSLIRLIIVSPYYLYTLSRFSQLVTTINLIRTDPTKSKSKKKNELNEKKYKIETKPKTKKIPKNPTNYDLTKQSLWLAFPATLLQWTAG